jgi:hypothetical protein
VDEFLILLTGTVPLTPGANYLLVEPLGHVSAVAFQRMVEIARTTGLKPIVERKVLLSRAQLSE